jgi:hypothetical protein
MAQYDLTSRMGAFVDPQMLLAMLDFLKDEKVRNARGVLSAASECSAAHARPARAQVFPEEEVLKQRFLLLQKTSLVDLTIETFHKLHGAEATVPAGA